MRVAEQVVQELSSPSTASRHLMEYALLRSADLGDLADELVAESNEVARDARRRVTALLRERFGGRRPQLSGWHSLLVFLLAFAGVVPAALLATARFGTSVGSNATAAAISAGIIGVLQWLVAVSVLGKPVPRSTLIQAQVSAALLVGVCLLGLATGSSSVSSLFVVGAGSSILALGMYVYGRRDPQKRHSIDNALETAYLDVGADVALKREQILRPLPIELRECGIDIDALRSVRSAAIALLRERGNPVVDDAPESVPGYYLVIGHTGAWLPPTHRDAISG